MSCTIQKKKKGTEGVTTQGCGNCCEYFYPKEIRILKNCARYHLGFKYCAHCEISVQIDAIRCQCCSQLLRSKKRSKTELNN